MMASATSIDREEGNIWPSISPTGKVHRLKCPLQSNTGDRLKHAKKCLQRQHSTAAPAPAESAASSINCCLILYEKYLKRFMIVLVQKSLVSHVDRLLVVSHLDPWLKLPWQGHLESNRSGVATMIWYSLLRNRGLSNKLLHENSKLVIKSWKAELARDIS